MLTIHNIKFDILSDNVSLGNSDNYDAQNINYIVAGYTDKNTQYYQAFELPEEYHTFIFKKLIQDSPNLLILKIIQSIKQN